MLSCADGLWRDVGRPPLHTKSLRRVLGHLRGRNRGTEKAQHFPLDVALNYYVSSPGIKTEAASGAIAGKVCD